MDWVIGGFNRVERVDRVEGDVKVKPQIIQSQIIQSSINLRIFILLMRLQKGDSPPANLDRKEER